MTQQSTDTAQQQTQADLLASRIQQFASEWNLHRMANAGRSVSVQTGGYKYTRIVDAGGTLAFIDNSTGDIFRTANNAAPSTSRVRGNVSSPARSILDANGNIPFLRRGRPPKASSAAPVDVNTPSDIA